jgi:hypothetical protein
MDAIKINELTYKSAPPNIVYKPGVEGSPDQGE